MISPSLTEPNRLGVYTGRTTNWPVVASTCVGAVLLVLMGKDSNGSWGDLLFVVPMSLVAVGTIVSVLTATSLRVTGGPNGFTIHWGLVGWPRSTYHLDDIDHAEVIDVPGWRVSYGFWWTPRRTTCTVRSGPAVRLRLHSGRLVTVTAPDPSAAVEALHAASNGRTQ